MLADDIIRPSISAWNSLLFLVDKPDGSFCPVVDFRRINDVTTTETYPLPQLQDWFDALGGAQFFSTLDLKSGYWQVPLDSSSKEKTAFSCHLGNFEFNVLPFGLKNAPAHFQKMMEIILSGLHWKRCIIYIDDIILFSTTFDDHLTTIREVFDALTKANLKIKPSKCTFVRPELNFLGHVISANGISPNPDKIIALQSYPVPKTRIHVHAF